MCSNKIFSNFLCGRKAVDGLRRSGYDHLDEFIPTIFEAVTKKYVKK